MKIKYYVKNTYGRPTLYPYGPGSERILRLIGQRTITPVQIQLFMDIGMEFEETVRPAGGEERKPMLFA